MKKLFVFSCIVLILKTLVITAQPIESNIYKVLRDGFLNPADLARPKVYWWCLNGNIDTVRAKQEFLAMKNAGIEGFDLFEIGTQSEDEIPAGPAFLSDESLKVIKFVIKEAGKLKLSVGLNVSSSWNAGGSWTLPKHAGKSIYHSKIIVKGNSTEQLIKVPFPEVSFPKASLIGGTGKQLVPFQANGKPEYYEEVAVLAIPGNIAKYSLDTNKIINVSRFFDSQKDLLSWQPPLGDWEIHRYICSNSGQQLVLPSPNSAGLTIDHFDSTAVRAHLMYVINRLKAVIGDFKNTALKSFYLASYEARGFVWTSSLPSEFRRINGYEIYKFLPSLFDPQIFNQKITSKIQADLKKTLSELMINNLYKKAKQICNSYGLKINSEAGGPGYPLYNGPAEPLKALGALDIPRGEFWVNHSRYYKDSNGRDSIDILRVVKEVSAASHIYDRGIAEEEAFTSFQHWQEGPYDLKPIGDRAFCEGMNRVVFHGFSHNPSGTGFPGIVYHAGTHINDKRVWWPKIKPFIEYISRVSYILQESRFVSDVLYYYGDKVPNAATAKNTHFIVGPGYDYEVINTEVLLNNLSVRNGNIVLSNEASFRILALENEEVMNPAVLNKLNELVKKGAIVIGARPQKIGETQNQSDFGIKKGKLLNQVWKSVNDHSKLEIDKNGKIYSGITPLDMLKTLDVPPDLNYSDKDSFLIDFIHYQKQDIDFYFLRNTSSKWITRECGFRQQNKVPEIWDPMTGAVFPVPIYRQDKSDIKIPITLAPYGSYFIAFRNAVPSDHYSDVSVSGQNPPLMEFTREGIIFLNEGKYELSKNSESIRIENKRNIEVIKGPWKVSFSNEWGAPDSIEFPELISWPNHTNPGIKYYSGIGTYHKSFYFEQNSTVSNDLRVYIELGEVSKVAELWLNGHSLGITWAKPFKYDITKYINNGENKLIVEVANTWSNRLTGDAITGERFTKTNITSMDGIPWAKVPLIKSGLIGPVTIQTVQLVR